VIIALDIATKLGFAHGAPGANAPDLVWGVRNFSGKEGTGEVIGKFRGWLQSRCYELKPTLIAFESVYIPVARKRQPNDREDGPPPMNPAVLERLLGMTGAVEGLGWELGIKVAKATTTEIVKFFTGKGSHGNRDQKKAAVVAQCRLHGWDVSNDNDADALALWAYAESIVNPRAHQHRIRAIGDRIGAGPLFSVSENESAPRSSQDRGAREPLELEPSNGKTEFNTF
jgi:hypothetical protein